MELDLCKQEIERNPNDYEAYYRLGKILAEQKKWTKAIAAYEKVIDLRNDIPEVYHDYGDALINFKSWKKAVIAYQNAINLNPHLSWSHHNLGVAFFRSGKVLKAIAAYSQAIALDCNNAQFHYSLAQALKFQQSWSEATISYEQAIDLGWDKWQIYHEYGDVLLNLELYDQAIASYQQAIKLNTTSDWSYHNLGVALFSLELFTEAITFFRQAIAINDTIASSYYYLGCIFSQVQKWDDAIAYFRQADRLKSDVPDLREKLALAIQQRASSDLALALEIFIDALEHCHNQVEIYRNIANILIQQDKFAQALVYATKAKKLQPEAIENITLVNFICQQRSKLYEPAFDFNIIDYSFNLWQQSHYLDREKLRQLCLNIEHLTATPLISIVLPITQSAKTWIEDVIAAIQAQIYPYWELCLAIGTSEKIQENLLTENEESILENILLFYQQKDLQKQLLGDQRISIKICPAQRNLAVIANQALDLAKGDFIALLAENTILAPEALFELATQLEKDITADIIYADQDCLQKVAERQERSLNPNPHTLEPKTYLLTEPWFKPDWNPDLLLSRNYFGSLVLCRHSLVRQVGGFNFKYDSQYIYDLLLRLTEITDRIFHIPKILSHSNGAAPANTERDFSSTAKEKRQVVTNALKRRKEPGKVISNPGFFQIQTVRYQIIKRALVSIIILTRNLGKMLNQCLESIFELTTYANFEVIVVDNGSSELETLEVIDFWLEKQPEKLRTIKQDIPFNYSYLNNQAVAHSRGKYLLFLNNDIKVISPDWLEAMVEQAQRKSIGAVGALLLYADDTVQHAGIILGVTGIAGHSHRHFSLQDPGYYSALVSTSNYSAVTGACMMCHREKFVQVGGFNEQLAVAYNDVDFCLKLQQKGYRNIFLPHVRLYHYESQSRTKEDTLEQQKRIKQEVSHMEATWSKLINHDPGYNINLTREQENFSLNLQASVEVTAIFFSETKESELWGFFLDEPKVGCVKRNFLDIIGWVVGRIADAIAIQVIWGTKVIMATDIKEYRPDVAQVYPQVPSAANSGFATTINILDLPQNNAELTLQVILANQTKATLGTIHLSLNNNH